MTLTIKKGSKEATVPFSASKSVQTLKEEISKAFRLNIHRQGLSIDAPADTPRDKIVRLANNKKTMADYGVKDGAVVIVKDLGPQIGYRTVFVVEYLGPILIVLLYALRPSFIYGSKDGFSISEYGKVISAGVSALVSSATTGDVLGFPAKLNAAIAANTGKASPKGHWDPIALLGVALWVLHFVKRELETFFVHKFSRPTMPLGNLFKNSMYYWGFALVVGYVLCHPAYTAPVNSTQIMIGVALMLVSELVNFLVHFQLSRMRPAEGSDKRDAPGGPLFALVSCPNYTAEVLSWVGFTIFTQIATSGLFTFVGFAQMTQWALGKHKGYIKQDESYKKLGRKAIVPFLI